MIGEPLNDHECLGKITAEVRGKVESAVLREMATRYPTTRALVRGIRAMPHLVDDGTSTGPDVVACDVPQRLRLPATNPNCVERSALYLLLAEYINPAAVRQLVDEGRGAAWSCASCHGERGQGTLNVPRLAGLPADYIVKQLKNYLDGSRRNENMEVVARTLAPAEMQALGEFYAAIRAPSNAYARLGGDLARGEELALRGDWSKDIPSCFSCHGPSGVGVAPEFPALAAQHPEYTVAQLAGWVAGRRDNSDIQLMDHIARALDDGDRRAVADYLATLPPVPAAPAMPTPAPVAQ